MDRAALRELFDVPTFAWDSYGRAVARLPDGALLKPVAGSGWPALRDALFHMATSWDNWMRNRLGVDDPLDAMPESCTSWDDLQAHRSKIRGWLRTIIDDTADDDLLVKTEMTWAARCKRRQRRSSPTSSSTSAATTAMS